MKIEIVCMRTDFFCKERKILLGKELLFSFCLMTEGTVKIADVGNFKIYFFIHNIKLFSTDLCGSPVIIFPKKGRIIR